MTKKEKVLVFTNIITAILLVVLGGILLLSNNKDVKAENKDEQKNTDTDNCVQESKVDGYLVYSDGYEEYKIYSMKDKTLKVFSSELGDKVIAENVNKTYDIRVGQSDMCEGNRWIIANTEDNKFIAVNVDAMVCGNKLKTLDVSHELYKLNLNYTISIYNTETFTNQFEPNMINVFAINEDGVSTEITSIFEE